MRNYLLRIHRIAERVNCSSSPPITLTWTDSKQSLDMPKECICEKEAGK